MERTAHALPLTADGTTDGKPPTAGGLSRLKDENSDKNTDAEGVKK